MTLIKRVSPVRSYQSAASSGRVYGYFKVVGLEVQYTVCPLRDKKSPGDPKVQPNLGNLEEFLTRCVVTLYT